MKIFLILTLVLMVGCHASQKAEKTIKTEVATVETPEKVSSSNSHLCNAPTKAGGFCTRKVSNEQDANALCFQHRAK